MLQTCSMLASRLMTSIHDTYFMHTIFYAYETSRQRHDSGIFNRKSNVALTAWNHRSPLPIGHGRSCVKQRYSSAMEKNLQRLLKTDCDLYCRYLQRWIVPGEVQADKLPPRLWTVISLIIPSPSPGTWHGDSSQTTQVWLTLPPFRHSWTLNERRVQYIPAGVSLRDWHLSLSLQ